MTFRLQDDFVSPYQEKTSPFGFVDAAGTSLGEITFIRTYSRLKEDGTKETWTDTCRRVIEGMYELQRQYVTSHNLPWSGRKAQASAQDAFDRLWNLKWTPPGRGLWAMGTPMVMSGNSAPLQNCAMISTASMTKIDPGKVFAWMMEASMLGVGVGFDGKGAERGFKVHVPGHELATMGKSDEWTYVIPDSREGWAESLRLLINSYLVPQQRAVMFDYSLIRPAGEPIKTFGGTASGPEPLKELHLQVSALLGKIATEGNRSSSSYLDVETIADIGNLIGVCVVAGNVRRSAELFMGSIHDETFLSLKDFDSEIGRDRASWSWMSNNSVEVSVDDDLDSIVPGILRNGEPGVIWMDTTRQYGRLADPPNNRDWRVAGYNPCAEQPLESFEMCTLVETYPSKHDNLEDYLRTLKYAYLYGKTVTLLTTPWPETNAIMLRNRRIGTSMSGLADFIDARGESELVRWMDAGYEKIWDLDTTYSEWLGVRNSIKMTTCKPSGTVSLLAGVSPGVHWQPGSKHYYRLIRVGNHDPLVEAAKDAGYRVEPALSDPESTSVIYFPMVRDSKRGEHDVPLLEKLNLAMVAQKYWSDNGVSVTLTYSDSETSLIGSVLKLARGNLKSASFLPLLDGVYAQMPYTQSDAETIEKQSAGMTRIDTARLYANGVEALGEKFCTTDVCELKYESEN